MGLISVFKDPRRTLNSKFQRKIICGLALTKLRQNIVKRYVKVLLVTRRNRQFNNFAVEMNFYFGFENREKTLQILHADPNHKMQIMKQAEKIVNHCFKLLGSGEVKLGNKIDWHCDFKSGYRWPRKYYPLLEFGKSSEGSNLGNADIKVPWELSRFQHLLVLGQAYWLSGDEKYTQEFMAEITSWIEENPPEMGVNWVCSMDISLRVVSMIFAYFYFGLSPVVGKNFWNRYFTLLYYSGVHIEQNPEVRYHGHRNNHYLTNCAALVWLGLFFSRYNRRTIKWLKNGLENLYTEMDYEVNADGGSFEGSIAYHRFALELFLCTTILAENNDLIFPADYKQRLEKMCEFSMHYTKSNGYAPLFGDVDDGRFCILSGYGVDDMRDHRCLLGIAGEYFKRDDFRKAAAEKSLDSLWLLGRFEHHEEGLVSYPELVKYPETGYYCIRKAEVFLMIKCGSIGQKNKGGHDHNDQLSFELSIMGVDLIVDPGSYVYSMDKNLRYLFRSTKYHNVSQLGCFEQNTIKNEANKDMFTMYSCNPGICTFFDKTFDADVRFLGQIAIAETDFIYLRSIELKDSVKQLNFTDTFKGTKDGCTCRLHLAKDVLVEYLNNKTVVLRRNHISVRIETTVAISLEVGMLSPSYGEKYQAAILCWEFQGQTQFSIYY